MKIEKKDKIEIIHKIIDDQLQHTFIDVELWNIQKHQILFENDVDEYFIDELMDDLNIEFKYVLMDDENQQYIIQIDPVEFEIKNTIESYDDLIKFIKENELYDNLFENVVEFNDKRNLIGMNQYMDYIHEKNINYSNFKSFELKDDDDESSLLFKMKKILNNEFIHDIELYVDIYDFIQDNIDYYHIYKDYDIELNDYNNIIINNHDKTIENIDDVYYLSCMIINHYLFLNDNKRILQDDIIELYNILKMESKIIKYDDMIIEINIDPVEFYQYYDNTYKFYKELQDDFIEYYDNYQLNIFESLDCVLNIVVVDYEYVINQLFNIDDVMEFIIDYVDVDYDYINYDNYIALNNFFYDVYHNHHLKESNEKIYENVYRLNQIKLQE